LKQSAGALTSGLVMALSGALVSQAQPGAPTGNRELVIHLYNLAGVPEPSLGRAINRAADVLATAGINPVWWRGPIEAAEAHKVDLGKHTDRVAGDHLNREFIVLVLSENVPVHYVEGALGIAFPESETGVSAMVFYDRIERLTKAYETDGTTVLGFAIAHEIGHVLLRSSGHGNFGIMKSPWTRADLQCAQARLATFTHAEHDAIWQHIRSDFERPR
jgi:hypothetical protein